MDWWFRLATFVVLGLGIILANSWYLRGVTRFFCPRFPDVIAPFQVSGEEDAGQARGKAMAHMLQAKLQHLNDQVKTAKQILVELDYVEEPTSVDRIPPSLAVTKAPGLTPVVREARTREPLQIPSRVLQPFDLQITVGGVQLTGFIAWIQKLVEQPNVLETTVHYQGSTPETKKAYVAVALGDLGTGIWIELKDASEATIVSALAISIWQQQSNHGLREADAFAPLEFETLIRLLAETAELEKRRLAGRSDPAAWENQMEQYEELIEKVPTWVELLRLAGAVADRADDEYRQLEWAEQELDILNSRSSGEQGNPLWRKALLGKGQSNEQIDEQLATMRGRIQEIEKLLAENNQENVAAASSPITVKAVQDFPPQESLANIKSILNWPADWDHASATTGNDIVVGIVGVPWHSGILETDTEETTYGESMLRDYTGAQASIVRYLMPSVGIKVLELPDSRTGSASNEDISNAIHNAITEDIDVVLVSFGGSEIPQTMQTAYQEVTAAGRICVISTGNDREHIGAIERSNTLLNQVIAVAGATKVGQVAYFCTSVTRRDQMVWTLAVDIPVRLPAGGQQWSGTGPASAIVTAVVARLKQEFPKATPQQLHAAVRDTAKPKVDNGPPLLDATASREHLRTALSQ